jgi:glucose/arabinose dehydrogenase
VLFAAALATSAAHASLAVVPQLFATGFQSPVDIVATGHGPGQLFVVEQAGRIRILRNGVVDATPFLDIRNLVATGGERGLLGLALHPGFAANGRFFVNYTRAGDGATVIAEFAVSAGNRNVANPASLRELMTIAQPFENHNGGALRFGPDGFLYIGMGDGGSGNDPGNRAQNPQELLGKILRIDVDAAPPYGIPPGNAYATPGEGRPEIWALGLRNPWRMSFDRVTGDLYIGDVGQSAVEEIDFVPRNGGAGLNFGWRVMEGNNCTGLGGGAPCGSTAFVAPIATYEHNLGCSVSGGVVYRGSAVPVMQGRYLYGDFCSGRIWTASRDRDGRWAVEVLLEPGHMIATFGEDSAGEVYWSDFAGGNVYRLAASPAAPVSVEYFNETLGHYFMTAFPEEAAFLDAGALGGAWKRTGFAFPAGPDDALAVDVCRLFGTPGVGPNTHFYTGNAAECASLRANPLWTFEATAFRTRMPVDDACAPPLRPVYRLYSNPTTLAGVNHRYTADGATYAAMQAKGWIGEGVAFCVP